MSRIKIASVVGARPQFIKAAAVSRALRALGEETGVQEVMIHTGQHSDPEMSGDFFRELDVPEPTFKLGIRGGGHGVMTGRMMESIEPILQAERPAAVLIYGDTNSTLAGALTASKLHIPVAHVEAGLRSFNRRMPEEINRVVSDHLSTILYCPTSAAIENLAREGITMGIENFGDVMYDTTLHAADRAREASSMLKRLCLDDGDFAVATVHRAENTDDTASLARVIDYLRGKAEERPMVFLIHPRTRAAIERFRLSLDGLTVVSPCGYLDMHRLLDGAATVYTDSGGLQKEAYFHRTPCVTLRGETEWIETVEHGWNRLWRGPDYRPRRDIPEYGDGNASRKIAAHLADWLTRGPIPRSA